MAFYWEPTSTPKKKSTSGKRIMAVIVILMIVVSTGLVYIINIIPGSNAPAAKVRVAILDSGIDVDIGLQGRVVAEASFITLDNGYDFEDLSTTDSRPEGIPHGTIIAKQLATSPNIEIV
ncbi:MAG: hypothetical protein KAJ36_03295, partial [Candidatus Thorarchaeota archaeon]|nr:hypothetical protein [Candidatus Thorarchaeota archaeon]